jgi:hypothetical protein
MDVRSFFAVLLLLGVCAGCNRSALPTVKDAGALRIACLDLHYMDGPDNIPANKWPDAINSLFPTRVLRFPDHIEILLTERSSTDLRGYWVCRNPDADPEPTVFKLSPTPDKGIYQFEHLNEKTAPLLATNQGSHQPNRDNGIQGNPAPSK